MTQRLVETMQARLVLEPREPASIYSMMLSEWRATPYPELSVVLVFLRHVALLHQTHHWQAAGDPFYGDHLLFERIYNGTLEDVDAIAERAVGLGTTMNVDLATQARQLNDLCTLEARPGSIPLASELAARSYNAELMLLRVIALATAQMEAEGTLTSGLANLLAGIEDKHEGHCYLLKQRLGT